MKRNNIINRTLKVIRTTVDISAYYSKDGGIYVFDNKLRIYVDDEFDIVFYEETHFKGTWYDNETEVKCIAKILQYVFNYYCQKELYNAID